VPAVSQVELPKRDILSQNWLIAAGALAAGLLLLALVFRIEVAAALHVWRTSTAFNHCFLVPFVVGYLVWDRRDALTITPPFPVSLSWIALAALPVSVGWFVAERLGFMEGQQLLAIVFAQIFILSVLGVNAVRTFAAPILYLFFLVPFGEFLVPWLQNFTAHFITIGLDIFGIPNYANGVAIEIPEGNFYVAAACAGLRFLIASLAFGVLYSCIIYHGVKRRLIFIAVSVVVPIIANGIRALGTIMAAHLIGNAQAVEIDHIFYGWLFFSLITIMLMLLGLPFRDQPRNALPRNNTPRSPSIAKPAGFAVAFMVLMATTSHLLAAYLDGGPLPAISQLEFPVLAGCQFAAVPPTFVTKSIAADRAASVFRGYQCGGNIFVVTLRSFTARIGARPLVQEQNLPLEEVGWDRVSAARFSLGSGPDAPNWVETEFAHGGRLLISASALWIAGRPSEGIHSRILQALNSIQPSPRVPVVAIVIYDAGEKAPNPVQVLNNFLADLNPLSEEIHRFADADSAPATRRQ
jgi:exosortase A